MGRVSVSSAGNTRGLIEARVTPASRPPLPISSSAGNTRGLIEARSRGTSRSAGRRLPRGIPAASLKLVWALRRYSLASGRLPRGIPAASLKRKELPDGGVETDRSSAGNTRGLIEAPPYLFPPILLPQRLPRGIPAASLKPGVEASRVKNSMSSAGNTRGLIEARRLSSARRSRSTSSAGNTRGLIEAPVPWLW